MIERYSREEMAKIWDLNSKFNYYLQVELAVCDAYAELGTIPKEAANEIREKATFTVERIDEIEREVRHDVIAFLTCVNESLGDLGRYVHVGMTSSDVIDTAFALQIQDSGKIILADLDKTIATLRTLAEKHKDTVCIGRSHGIPPTCCGQRQYSWQLPQSGPFFARRYINGCFLPENCS